MQNLLRSLALMPVLLGSIASAAVLDFEQATFDALQKEGSPVLVMVHADWCPTCKAQRAVLTPLLQTPQMRPLTALRVDFDNQAGIVKSFHVATQSTLIVFRDGREVGRAAGVTSPEAIESLLRKAL